MSIFVTDSSYKHTLGIVRSLSQKNISVDVGSSSHGITLSSLSKYCRSSYVYPDPRKEMEQFVRFFRRIQNLLRYDVIIPVGYTSTYFLSMNKKAIAEGNIIPVSDFSDLRLAANKRDSFLLAKEIGVPIPQTFFVKSDSELDDISVKNYPIVVKGALEGGCVRYAYSKQDLRNKFREIYRLQGVLPVVQEFIQGQGYGFFGLFNHGKPRAVFMHKRVRERYVTGGSSTCAESVYDRDLLDYGLKILKSLTWHGVAMVEFKQDEADGEFKMMEINPKFWGSLDLAIASGVDFPFLLYKMAIDGDVNSVFSYRTGVRFMWPFPDDILHVFDTRSDVTNFLSDLFNRHVKKNIDIHDLGPISAPILDSLSIVHSRLFGDT